MFGVIKVELEGEMRERLEISRRILARVYKKFVSGKEIYQYSAEETWVEIPRSLLGGRVVAETESGERLTKAAEVAEEMRLMILSETGLETRAGVGTNLYLAKVAADILAKNSQGGGVERLDERRYKEELWRHKPITDFLGVRAETAERLGEVNVLTMGDVARVSLREEGEAWLREQFGEKVEVLIDHAFGIEMVRVRDINENKSERGWMERSREVRPVAGGRVGRMITMQEAEKLAREMAERNLETNMLTLGLKFEGGGQRRGMISPINKSGEACYSASVKRITERVGVLFDEVYEAGKRVQKIELTVENLTRVGTGRRKWK